MKNETLKRENEFKRELGKLLRKYNTDIELEYEQGGGYHQDRLMVCYLDSIWKDDEQITNYSRIEFGSYIPRTIGL
jgi:hypothetical protein